jgi:beta-carotene 3-hydroxylase
MSSWMIWGPLVLLTAYGMEHWARMLHGRVWHRSLWKMHRSHHAPRRGRFEANDLLSSSHSFLAIALIVYGFEGAPGILREAAFGIGVGMTVFGFAYVAIHDGFVHGRLPLKFLERFSYFRRVRAAHKAHHGRPHAAPFGFFLGPWELAAEERSEARRSQATSIEQSAGRH